jgi:hypothetical protein
MFPAIYLTCSANFKALSLAPMSGQFEGSCLCGAVRFVATGTTGIGSVVPLRKLSEA